MIDWANPANRPQTSSIQEGETVTGTVTALAFEPNLRGQVTLTWSLDGGRKRWANTQLWRAMADARIQPGDRITVTRGPDEPSTGQYPRTTWTVTRHSGPAPIAAAPVAVAAPAAVPVPAAPTQPALPDW